MTDYIRKVRAVLSEIAVEGAPLIGTYSDQRVTDILGTNSALRIVQEVLNDEHAVAEIAARSYTHTNGFDKFTLISNRQPEFKLRLHAWWPNGNNSKNGEFIHNHRWCFRSTTLCGSVHVETFTQRDSGEPMYRHEYRPRDAAKETYGLTVVGRSNLALDMMLTLEPGSTYTMGPDLLHRVIRASDAATITLFVRWATTQETASVFAESPILDEGLLSVPSFTSDELRSKLQNVAAVLGPRQPTIN
jgi:hypothetical protein